MDNVTIYTLEEFLAIDENKKKLVEAYARIVEKKNEQRRFAYRYM